MAIVFVSGTWNVQSTSSTAYFTGGAAGYNNISFGAEFVNNSGSNTHTWFIDSPGGSSSGTFGPGTVSRSRNQVVGENVSGTVTLRKNGPNGAELGRATANFTTGYSYDDTPTPPPTPAPSFTDTTVAGGILGKSYSDGVSASTTTSYAIASGSLPTGLSLNTSSGAITGTPTVQGSFTFAITASGGGGSTGSGNLTIQVLPPGNRRNSSDFASNLAVAKRYNGTSWVNLTTMKRFNGTAWVNISN